MLKLFLKIVLWFIIWVVAMFGFGICFLLGYEVVGPVGHQHAIVVNPTLVNIGAIGFAIGMLVLLWGIIVLRWTILVQFTSREWTIGRRSVREGDII